MTALNTFELEHLLHHLVHRPRRMVNLGVFPADRVPTLKTIRSVLKGGSLSCCFIANTDPACKPGKHWVLFVANTSGTAGKIQMEYFDSYALPLWLHADLLAGCSRKRLLPLINVVSNVSLQAMSSFVCGHYCVLFAYFRANGRSFRWIQNYFRSFGSEALQRDKRVVIALHSVMHSRNASSYSNLGRLVRDGLKSQSCCCSDAR